MREPASPETRAGLPAEDPADDATLPSPVEAPPAPGAELVAEGRRRYEAGDHADAEPLARRALELRPPGSDPAARSEALQLLGEVCYGRGRYAEARALADEAAALRAGAPDEDRAETENLQGILDLALSDHGRGLERVRHAYELREAALGPDHADTLESLNNTGVALGRVDRMDEAIAAHEEALRRCERAFSAPHRQLAVSLNAIAVKLDKAEETRERAHELAVRALEAAEAALGPEHPLVATLTSNLATQRLNADDVEAARAYVERSIDLHERRHGPDHPNTATALLTAAAIAMRDGRATDARDLFERVVATRLDAFGLADRRTKVAVAGLVNASASLLQTDPSVEHEAVALFGVYRNLDDEKARSGPLGFGKADPAEAERALRAYLARAAERRPTEDPAVRRALDQATASMMSADASFMAGDLDAATVALEVAIERIEGAKGTESLLLIEPLHRLAAIERVRSARDRAIDVDRRALAILAAAYGERHPYVMGGIAGLAMETAAEWGPAAARPEMERLLEVVSSAEGGIAGRLRSTIERQLELLERGPEPTETGLSARRRAALAAPSPLAGELLRDLDQVPWRTLRHAGGPAFGTPDELRLLLAEDAGVAREATGRLAGMLVADGPTPAGVAALPFLVRIAGDVRVTIRARAGAFWIAVGMLREAIEGGADPSQDGDGAERAALRRSVLAHEPAIGRLIQRLAASGSDDERRLGTWAAGELRGGRLRAAPREGRLN